MSHLLDFLIKANSDKMDSPNSPENINDMDMSINFDSEFMSSDFFDSVLSMEKTNNMNFLNDDLLNGINSDFNSGKISPSVDEFFTETKFDYNSNEETVQSPILKDSHSESASSDEDHFNAFNNVTLFGTSNNSESFINQEVYSLLPNNISNFITVSSPQNNIKREQPSNIPKKLVPKTIQHNKKGMQAKKQVIRVQSLANNGRSLLLPLNMKNVKKFKIINANDLKVENIKVLPASCQQMIRKVEKYAASTSSESVDDIDGDVESIGVERSYPALELTAEEKRLLTKEGIYLPSHYPLTKNDEKELKRIRRKIRNKISAQDSRKRKKEYVDQLEEKARRTDEENEILKKRVKILNKENTKLCEQLKKLQDLLFSSSKATPTTCLMIVLFSTLLVCLPNLRSAENKDLDMGEPQILSRRVLLYNKQGREDEESNLEDLVSFVKEENDVHFEEEEKENGTRAFAQYIGELSKTYETLIKKNCTEILQGGTLHEFCKRHEDDLKLAMQNLQVFMDHHSKIEEKKFIEPDISDDEGDIPIFKRRNAYLLDDDDPPTKKIRISNEVLDYEGMPAIQVVNKGDAAKSLPTKKQ